MKRNAWRQSLESAFGKNIENQIKPMIDSILNAPYNTFAEDVCVDVLSKKYNTIFNYVLQVSMLQLSNTNRKIDSKIIDTFELMLESVGEANIISLEHLFLVRFNHQKFANRPLVLIDNAISIFVPSERHSLKYSLCMIMPISPCFMIFAGSSSQLRHFLNLYSTPHTINLYRILCEEKRCLVASQNESYIKWLSSEYMHYKFGKTGATPQTLRTFE